LNGFISRIKKSELKKLSSDIFLSLLIFSPYEKIYYFKNIIGFIYQYFTKSTEIIIRKRGKTNGRY